MPAWYLVANTSEPILDLTTSFAVWCAVFLYLTDKKESHFWSCFILFISNFYNPISLHPIPPQLMLLRPPKSPPFVIYTSPQLEYSVMIIIIVLHVLSRFFSIICNICAENNFETHIYEILKIILIMGTFLGEEILNKTPKTFIQISNLFYYG